MVLEWLWKAKPAPAAEHDSDWWRVWREQLPKFIHLEPIARELCLEFGQDPDGGDERIPNWQYQASELNVLRQRMLALRRAGLLD